MTPAGLLILAIIDKSLSLIIEIMRSMPEDQKRAAWEAHQRRIEFWQNLFERFAPDAQPPQAK